MRIFLEKTGVGRGFARGWAAARQSRTVSDERGFLLIEVMISAMLVALIAVGSFSAFDVSGRVQSDERDRAQAVTLAQQDEERLRGLTSAELSSLNEENPVTIQKVKYTIVSKATFVSDTTGAESCSEEEGADYFKTTSEVRWATIGKRPPIVQTGLVAPPAGGELEVVANDGRGGFTSGMNITGTGPAGFSGTTPASGCLIFGPLEEGTYTVNASQTGYVGIDGETEVPVANRARSVTGQTTATDPLVFNKAGKIEAKPETAPSTLGGAQTINVVVGQTGMSTNRTLLASTSGYTTATTITSPQTFFPFPTGYTIYAGTCAANLPSASGGTNLSTPTLEPGGTVSQKVIEPGMIVLLYKGKEGNATAKEGLISKPEILIKDTDSGCDNTSYKVNTVTAPNTTTGDLEKPGLPYGKYTVCANFLKGSTKTHASATVENKNISIGTTVNLYEGGSSPEVTSGSNCP
jgi:Tfp pilus assembly protein PilV